jgi:glycosyltransferase involved in cell wall biosynthesis
VSTAKDSLNSLIGQLNEDYEVIIVDNFSTDGTFEVLREFEQSHKVKVIQRRCSRGLGRQTAFENASGDFIIANLDLDDVFKPVLNKLVNLYHERFEGKLAAIFNSATSPNDQWIQNLTIGPRDLIESLGGWRDLNFYEDWDIWSRASAIDEYRWTVLEFAQNKSVNSESTKSVNRLKQRYQRYRDRLRLGLNVFSPGESIGAYQRLAYISARLVLLYRGTLRGQDPRFNWLNPHHFVSLGPSEGR